MKQQLGCVGFEFLIMCFRHWHVVVCLWQITWKGETLLPILGYKQIHVLFKLDSTNIFKHMHVLGILSFFHCGQTLRSSRSTEGRNRSNKKTGRKNKALDWVLEDSTKLPGIIKQVGKVGQAQRRARGKVFMWERERLVRYSVSWGEFTGCCVCFCVIVYV